MRSNYSGHAAVQLAMVVNIVIWLLYGTLRAQARGWGLLILTCDYSAVNHCTAHGVGSGNSVAGFSLGINVSLAIT